MNIPQGKSLAGRRVKLKGRAGWGTVELDTGALIKVREGLRSPAWHSRDMVTHVDPPFMPDAGAPTP